jgi:flagellar motor switch protein FliM
VEFTGVGGSLHICMPYAMIEPIRELLYSTMQGDHVIADKRWLHMLSKQIQSAEIDLTAVLGHAMTNLDHVLKMRIGDIIPLEVSDNIQVLVDNVPVMECKYGSSNGQYALKVEKMLATEPAESLIGGKND